MKPRFVFRLATLAAAAVFSLAVQPARAANPQTQGAQDQPGMQGRQGTPVAPSDPEIAAILQAANKIDIDNGKLAQDQAKSTPVKEFANRMVTDHQSSSKQAKGLLKDLKVEAKENDTSKSLLKTADQTRDRLKGLKGAEFDRAYIDNEVSFHEQVISTLDQTLLPNAQNPKLKAFIQELRPTLQSHLEHAKQVRSGLQAS